MQLETGALSPFSGLLFLPDFESKCSVSLSSSDTHDPSHDASSHTCCVWVDRSDLMQSYTQSEVLVPSGYVDKNVVSL